MDFDSPEERKNFPGLYSSEKRRATDDYNNDSEKATKKEMIIGKRKDKKDKKDKDKGYAALEGESSEDESPCKAKKSKAFKFSKSKDKDKSVASSSKYKIKKKAKPQKVPKGKSVCTIHQDLSVELAIFGSSLKNACQRGMCHDGVFIPLPVRECIDFIEESGVGFENVYKTSGNKQKVQVIKKTYDNRQPVSLHEYDVPTVTSVFKLFFRELTDPLLTSELAAKFEEAAAILTRHTKIKHLKALILSLPYENQIVLGWVIVHLSHIAEKEQINKMSVQNLAQALHHSLHTSSKVLGSLISFTEDLFTNVKITKYYPPLKSGMPYPEAPEKIAKELDKLESALNLIHWEMQHNYSSKSRQDQLWELQRIQTELKRKQKKAAKETQEDNQAQQVDQTEESVSGSEPQSSGGAEVEQLLTGSGGLEPINPDRPTDVKRLFDQFGEECSDEEEVMLAEESETEDEPDRESVGCCQEQDASENESEDVEEAELNDSDEDLDKSINSNILSDNQCAESCIPNMEIKSEDVPPSLRFELHRSSANECIKHTKLVQDVIQSGELINNKLECLNSEQIEQLSDNTLKFFDTYNSAEMLLAQHKNQMLKDFKNQLMGTIAEANLENAQTVSQFENHCWYVYAKAKKSADHFKKVVDLLQKENHMLQVNKIELIRKIMEEKEECVELEAVFKVCETLNKKK